MHDIYKHKRVFNKHCHRFAHKSTVEVTVTRTVSPTDVVGEEVGREAFGAVAERRVVVRVATKDEQRAAEEHSGVQVPREAALFQNEPGTNA